MTTVAWDGEIVAADTMVTIGEGQTTPGDRVKKVLELPDGTLFCGAGRYSEWMRVYDWMANGKKDPMPKVEHVEILLVDSSGARTMEEDLYEMPVTARYAAIGSGWKCAVVAMELGKNAKQAVAIAMKFDRNTGGTIQTFIPNKVKKPRRKAACHDQRTRTTSKARSAHSRKSARSVRSSARKGRS